MPFVTNTNLEIKLTRRKKRQQRHPPPSPLPPPLPPAAPYTPPLITHTPLIPHTPIIPHTPPSLSGLVSFPPHLPIPPSPPLHLLIFFILSLPCLNLKLLFLFLFLCLLHSLRHSPLFLFFSLPSSRPPPTPSSSSIIGPLPISTSSPALRSTLPQSSSVSPFSILHSSLCVAVFVHCWTSSFLFC